MQFVRRTLRYCSVQMTSHCRTQSEVCRLSEISLSLLSILRTTITDIEYSSDEEANAIVQRRKPIAAMQQGYKSVTIYAIKDSVFETVA